MPSVIAEHEVCFDSDGSLLMNKKYNYPVKKFSGLQRGNGEFRAISYWEVKFKMPATVYGFSITGRTISDTQGLTVKLLGERRNKEFKSEGRVNYGIKIKDVYYVRIEKSKKTFNLKSVKVFGIQTPAISCSKAQSIAGGCYSIYRTNGFPNIQFWCRRGFEILGNVSNSSITHRCSNVSSQSVNCQQLELRCPAPPKLLHSQQTIRHKTYYEKETIRYHCNPDYYLVGPQVLTCDRNGNWIPRGISTCQKTAVCPTPAEPTNGGKIGSNYKVGQSVSFFCYPGYQLLGTKEVQCTLNGTWNLPPDVICKAKECPSIDRDAVVNGEILLTEVEQNGFTYGNFLEVKCSSGFFLTGNSIITCTESGIWDSQLPNCTAKIGLCSSITCGMQKECVEKSGKAECVCSASLQHGCLSDVLPVCASNNMTFWSHCDMLNYSCLNPDEHFSIVQFSPCRDEQLMFSKPTAIEKKFFYKCGFPKEASVCRAHFLRFYFDQEQNNCQQFRWGGCNPNANNFETLEECESTCREFRQCNRSQRFESDLEKNLALKRPTTPESSLAASFVDGNRVVNESHSNNTEFWSWKVALKAPAIVTKVVVWNSDKTISWLNVAVRDETGVISSQYFTESGRCRYVWTLPEVEPVIYVEINTSQIDTLNVDEVEVIGKLIRGILINLTEANASAQQYPSTFEYNGTPASAEKAINGKLENNTALDGFIHCASTAHSKTLEHWFQLDLKSAYFITEVGLWLRKGQFRREWQRGLTVHVSNKPGSFLKSLPVSPENRCGDPYTQTHEMHPIFPCYFDYATRYVIMKLIRKHYYGLQLCEVQVFAVACHTPQKINHATLQSTKKRVFAPSDISFICDRGYQAVPSVEYSCARTGQWFKKSPKNSFCKKRRSNKTTRR